MKKICLSVFKNQNKYEIEEYPVSEFSDYWGRRLYKLLGVHIIDDTEYAIYVYSVEKHEYASSEAPYIARNFHIGNVIKFKIGK